jgi:anti-sigma factor RsiW
MTELSDDLLVAYIDGRLADKQGSAVAKVLEHDDVLARRVRALQSAHGRLEAAFDAIPAGEELDVAAEPAPERAGVFVPWSIAVKAGLAGTGIVAASIFLIAVFGLPRAVPEPTQHASDVAAPDYTGSVAQSWEEQAARAQAMLSRAGLEVGLESQSNRDLVAFQLGQAIGRPITLADLDEHGFRFVRAQLLRAGEEPLAQLLYLGPAGALLALYAKRGALSAPPTFNRYGTIGSVAWSDKGVAYLIAGEEDKVRLMQLAQAVRHQAVTANAPR